MVIWTIEAPISRDRYLSRAAPFLQLLRSITLILKFANCREKEWYGKEAYVLPS